MVKKIRKILLLLIVLATILNTGCSRTNNDNKIAYISSKPNSKYESTFNELHLGILFDFNLKLPKADTTWVTLWVEGYSNGKLVDPFPITELSYGISPKKVEEGPMGLGIIRPGHSKMEFFLYSFGSSTMPRIVDNNFLMDSTASSWNYTIGDKPIGLQSGEEKILAVYRQGKDSLRSGYDYENLDSIKEMIEESTSVLLLKVKVEGK